MRVVAVRFVSGVMPALVAVTADLPALVAVNVFGVTVVCVARVTPVPPTGGFDIPATSGLLSLAAFAIAAFAFALVTATTVASTTFSLCLPSKTVSGSH